MGSYKPLLTALWAFFLIACVPRAAGQVLNNNQLGLVVEGPQDAIIVDGGPLFQGIAVANSSTLGNSFPRAALGVQLAWLIKGIGVLKEYHTPRSPSPQPPPSPPSKSPSPAPSPSPSPPPPVEEFYIQAVGGRFLMGKAGSPGVCKVVYPSGANKYEFLEAGAGAPVLFDGKLVEAGLTAQAVVRRVLDDARAAGVTLLRFNAFAVDAQYKVLSADASGAVTYNEAVLAGLDYVLDEARKRGIRVLPVLSDYFADNAGGPLQYLELAGVSNNDSLSTDDFKSLFYTDSLAQEIYWNYTEAVVNRVNTINGRTYRNDPTIFGWDLQNEPRCTNTAAGVCTLGGGVLAISAWAAASAAFLKSLDSIHPVTVGLEGFYTTGPGTAVNPFAVAATYNNDFLQVSSQPGIDFASFNVYPDLWHQENSQWVVDWIQQHATDGADVLGKPVIIKELGMQPTPNRLPFYDDMYEVALSQIQNGSSSAAGGLRGAAYFQAFAEGTEAVWWTQAPGGRWGIFNTDAAFQTVADFSSDLAALQAQQPSQLCPLGNPNFAPVVLPVSQCPAGYEGPGCDVDINECVRGTDDCDVHAACIDTPGSYQCQCFTGYAGTGRSCGCTADASAQAQIAAAYYTNFGGNCLGAPADVAYPPTAPGWAYDPTGTFPPEGNRLNVTLLECETACNDTAGCTSFYYDAGQRQCFLKSGECPFFDICVAQPAVCSGLDYTGVPPTDPVEFSYQCGQGYSYYQKDAALPSGCTAPTASVVTPALSSNATALAAIPAALPSGADLAFVEAGSADIAIYNAQAGLETPYYTATDDYVPTRLAALPSGRLAYVGANDTDNGDTEYALYLEDAAGSQSFSAVLVNSSPLEWADLAAGGPQGAESLWGILDPTAPTWTFQQWAPGAAQLGQGAVLDRASLGLDSLLRFAVDPKGSLWVAASNPAGATFLYKLTGGTFALQHSSTPAGVGLCDLGFDVFGYLFATGFDAGDNAKSCTSGTSIYKSTSQVGLLDGNPAVSMVDAFAGSSIAAPQLRTLTAGPHSAAANLRGGNAVVYWVSLEDGGVLSTRTIYAPNIGF